VEPASRPRTPPLCFAHDDVGHWGIEERREKSEEWGIGGHHLHFADAVEGIAGASTVSILSPFCRWGDEETLRVSLRHEGPIRRPEREGEHESR
jgi:hypothetical protein